MSSGPSVHLTLPHWDGGSRRIRFIYLKNLTSFRLTECPDEDQAIPLYLGADVLFNTDIRTENHPRFHAKLAKKGLATKIHFSPAFRFQGLKVSASNNSLWFYSVEGLFRVAFEMYSKKDQLAVMDNFQNVWKSQINDSVLNISYSLSVQLDVCETVKRTEIPPPPRQQAGRKLEVKGGRDAADTSADHDYCSSPKTSSQTEQSWLVRQKLHSLHEQLSSEPPSCTEHMETVLLLLESIDRFLNGNMEEENVAEAVLALLQVTECSSAYSSSLLRCVGRWLGQRFHAANGSISQRVEGFKVQHIERISDLPPPEELATELFPDAMQMLLLHWMGLSEESSLEKRRSEYPILLLILEFANHNLITGVAHVLYSSLICK